ncbi:MAG: cation diffusion facilitator family transporter [Acidobacteria bacterium]|nr:cation diffusion facilitator family transporter [Acidobacteriota bacterium]
MALRLALALTSMFAVVEFAGGWFTNSLALMADAGHMLTDAAALGLSLFALWFASRPATSRKTYGFLRVEILAALVNGVTLVVISLFIFYEAYHRLLNPPPVKSGTMLVIACAGLVINLLCASALHRSHSSNLNVRGALLHVIGDALGSAGAIVAGILMLAAGWYVADPLISVLVGLSILYNSWRLVKDSVDILLEGTPAHIDLETVRNALSRVEGVASIHDLHVWTLTSGIHAMSCHAVVCGNEDRHQILERLSHIVRSRFEIDHTTIQLEEVSLRHQETRSCHECTTS